MSGRQCTGTGWPGWLHCYSSFCLMRARTAQEGLADSAGQFAAAPFVAKFPNVTVYDARRMVPVLGRFGAEIACPPPIGRNFFLSVYAKLGP